MSETKSIAVQWKWYDHTGCGANVWNKHDNMAYVPEGTDDEIEDYIEEELVDYADKSMEAYRGVKFRRLSKEEEIEWMTPEWKRDAAEDMFKALNLVYAGVINSSTEDRVVMNISKEAFKAMEAAIAKAKEPR